MVRYSPTPSSRFGRFEGHRDHGKVYVATSSNSWRKGGNGNNLFSPFLDMFFIFELRRKDPLWEKENTVLEKVSLPGYKDYLVKS